VSAKKAEDRSDQLQRKLSDYVVERVPWEHIKVLYQEKIRTDLDISTDEGLDRLLKSLDQVLRGDASGHDQGQAHRNTIYEVYQGFLNGIYIKRFKNDDDPAQERADANVAYFLGRRPVVPVSKERWGRVWYRCSLLLFQHSYYRQGLRPAVDLVDALRDRYAQAILPRSADASFL
jgi:hypothetical protein